jgi:hypothetical protein
LLLYTVVLFLFTYNNYNTLLYKLYLWSSVSPRNLNPISLTPSSLLEGSNRTLSKRLYACLNVNWICLINKKTKIHLLRSRENPKTHSIHCNSSKDWSRGGRHTKKPIQFSTKERNKRLIYSVWVPSKRELSAVYSRILRNNREEV